MVQTPRPGSNVSPLLTTHSFYVSLVLGRVIGGRVLVLLLGEGKRREEKGVVLLRYLRNLYLSYDAKCFNQCSHIMDFYPNLC